jgi:hypothetical protein
MTENGFSCTQMPILPKRKRQEEWNK